MFLSHHIETITSETVRGGSTDLIVFHKKTDDCEQILNWTFLKHNLFLHCAFFFLNDSVVK